jgi:hypothetical protein
LPNLGLSGHEGETGGGNDQQERDQMVPANRGFKYKMAKALKTVRVMTSCAILS